MFYNLLFIIDFTTFDQRALEVKKLNCGKFQMNPIIKNRDRKFGKNKTLAIYAFDFSKSSAHLM